jgi:hypothetical protein
MDRGGKGNEIKKQPKNKKSVCKTRRDNGREQKTKPSRIFIFASILVEVQLQLY